MIASLILLFCCGCIGLWILFEKYAYLKRNGEWREDVMGKYMTQLLITLMIWGGFVYLLIKFISEK